jgi:hypothetical protein
MTNLISLTFSERNYEKRVAKTLTLWVKIRDRNNKRDFESFYIYVKRINRLIQEEIFLQALIFKAYYLDTDEIDTILKNKVIAMLNFFSLNSLLDRIEKTISIKFG